MALLQVRNFPDDIYDEICTMAKKERRPISQQVILVMEKGLGRTEDPKERRRRALERTWARPVPESMKGVDFVAMIREDRDR
ncbi:MAG: hypothetical protein FWH32_08395 [Clostridiales bacterium]|nr:hypothetical protein [Clostridiales bacterium]